MSNITFMRVRVVVESVWLLTCQNTFAFVFIWQFRVNRILNERKYNKNVSKQKFHSDESL